MGSSKLPSIDWKDRGYFGFLDLKPDPTLSRGWTLWLTALHRSVVGDFTLLPELIDVARSTEDGVLIQSCFYLLGDAGGANIASRIRAEAESTDNFGLMIECCDALTARGWLADIPAVLNLYSKYFEERESKIIQVFISDLIEPKPGLLPDLSAGASIEEFREAVKRRHQEMTELLGTSQSPVFKAELFGIKRYSKWILSSVLRPHFRMYWRRKFEATTGKNCTSFYKDHTLKPLAVSALVEEFLESPEAERYEDGVRYFFGHRIPD